MRKAKEAWQALQAGKDRARAMFSGSAKELRKQPLASLLKAPTEARKKGAGMLLFFGRAL
ncbi:MAG: hypothetical protein LBI87_08040 [Candidatus Accumulibacter sp.]|jgi:hypothetical protein|nr:hypothetical protein [Accumulibacter sp.]